MKTYIENITAPNILTNPAKIFIDGEKPKVLTKAFTKNVTAPNIFIKKEKNHKTEQLKTLMYIIIENVTTPNILKKILKKISKDEPK